MSKASAQRGKRKPPKVQPEANERSAYFVSITDVNDNAVWRGVLDDTNVKLSLDAKTQEATVWIKATSLASYLKRKIER